MTLPSRTLPKGAPPAPPDSALSPRDGRPAAGVGGGGGWDGVGGWGGYGTLVVGLRGGRELKLEGVDADVVARGLEVLHVP